MSIQATKIAWWGKAGSFGSSLPSIQSTLEGYSFSCIDITGDQWPAGQSPWFPAVTLDGTTLLLPSQPLTTNGFLPTARTLVLAKLNLLTRVQVIDTIPTTNGTTNPESVAYAGFGGSDFEDICRVSVGGVEKYYAPLGRPYNDWSTIATKGVYRAAQLIGLNAGAWGVEAANSKTAAQIKASNATEAAHIYEDYTTAFTAETDTGNRNMTECETLPVSGHIFQGHYAHDSVHGFRGGALSVLDTAIALKQGYFIPNVRHPDDSQDIQASCRCMAVDPTSAANDERVIVLFDVFGLATGIANVLAADESTFEASVAGVEAIFGSCTLSQQTTAKRTGTYGCRVRATGTTGMACQGRAHPAEPGQYYTVSVWVKSAVTVRSCQMAVSWFSDVAGTAFISESLGSAGNDSTTVFTQFSATNKQAPWNARSYRWKFGVNTTTAVNEDHWLDDGDGRIVNTNPGRRFMMVEMAYNASTGAITAKSKPFWTGDNASQPEQVFFDDKGNLYVAETLVQTGLNNTTLKVYFKNPLTGVRSYVAALPAADTEWLNGTGGVSTDWNSIATPDVTVTGTDVGAFCSGLEWDTLNSVLYMVISSDGINSGVLAIQRSGYPGAYSYSIVGRAKAYFDLAPGGFATSPSKPVLDPINRMLWVPVRRQYLGAYPPGAPPAYDHYVLGVQLDFWLPTPPSGQFRATFTAPALPSYVGQRAETVEWEVLDPDNTPVGVVTPVDDGASVQNDVDRDIIRTVDQITLSEADCANLDMLTSRLSPVWVMDDLSRWPLGVFLFSAADRHPSSRLGQTIRTMSMYDQNTLLREKRREPFGLVRGSNIRSAIIQLIEECHISKYSIGGTGAVVSGSLAWPAGTARLAILRHLCALSGLLRPYFDNAGVLVIRSSSDLESATADIEYDTGPMSRINSDSIVTAQDLFDAPNVFLAVNSGATLSPISAYAVVPMTMPHSVQNRGREIVEEINLQGINDSQVALEVTQLAAAQRVNDFVTYDFEAAPDPRHDTYQIISVDAVNYREVMWKLACKRGGPHTHSLRLAYSLVQNPSDTVPSGVGAIMP